MYTQSTSAVFLSYASQDAEAAQHIAEALSAAGVEVWFDQGSLKGGAAWDAEIRRRIHECALFVPIISANTETRLEGYFRLEWRLAEQRTHLMVRGKPFLLPVAIDGTPDDGALVPDSFVDVQWTRLLGGEGAEVFARHIKGLLTQPDTPPSALGNGPPAVAASPMAHSLIRTVSARRRLIGAPGIAALVALVIGGALALWVLPGQRSGRVTQTAANAATPTAPRTAVAVLPFANLTGDASKEYLGDGMAEELISTLAKVKGLKVPARTSTFAYKGRNTDVRQIAKDLGVGTVLEGSVRAAGKRIRITAQLINAQDGLHLWSETYDEEFTDLFKLQDKLSTQIAKALQPSLGGAAEAVIAQGPPTQDVEAYNLFLKGQDLVTRPSVANLQQAIDYFQQAVARDPQFARAYAGIARAYSILPRNHPSQNAAPAIRLARQALAIDPQLVSAHVVLVDAFAVRLQLLDMETHARAALAAGANDGEAHGARGLASMVTGHIREATAEFRKALELAPANPLVLATMAAQDAGAGEYVEGQKFADAAAELGYPKEREPLTAAYAFLATRSGRYKEAAEYWSQISEFQQTPAAEVMRLAFAARENADRLDAALAARELFFPRSVVHDPDRAVKGTSSCMHAALWYAWLGTARAIDLAYDLANQCMDELVPGQILFMPWLWQPDRRAFRRDPRFQALATRMGYMDYWQQYGPPDDCDLKGGKLTCR